MSSAPRRPVLHLAVVVDDHVWDEVHQTRPEAVSVGSSYRNTLLVFGERVPRRHRLFDVRGDAYVLDIPAGAEGKLSLGRKAVTVAQLRKRMGVAAGHHVRISLPPDAKGKLKLGESVVMFRFGEPAPVPPAPVFPPEYRVHISHMMTRLEATTLAVAALFLGTYFTWMSNAEVDYTISVDDIPDRFVQAMGLVEKKPEPELPPEEEQVLAQEDEKKKVEVEDVPKPKPRDKPEKFSEQAMKQARSVGVARVLGTYGGPGQGTVFDVIQDTENNLGELFAQGMTSTVLADGGEISAFVPGGTGITAHGAAVETKGFAVGDGPELEAATEKTERVVKSNLKTTSTDVIGDVDKTMVQATIRRRMGALKHCYEKALRSQPDLAGKMTFTIAISVVGSVTSVAIDEDTVGDSAVRNCTKSKVQGWRFPMQGAEDTAEVTFSVVFSGG